MRHCIKNHRKMYYALYVGQEPVIALDDEGEPLIDEETGEPVQTGQKRNVYTLPVEFNESLSESGETTSVEFGTNTSDYDAIIIAPVNKYPINEESLVWYQSEIKYLDEEHTQVDRNSSDYTVESVKKSVNEVKYVLKRTMK